MKLKRLSFDAGGVNEAGASDDGGDASPTCTADAAASLASQAASDLEQVVTGTAPLCVGAASSANVQLCTTAACNSMMDTCAVTFSSSTFSFDPTTGSFTITTDVTAKGGAGYSSLSCSDLTLTSQSTAITGTLQMSVMGHQVTYAPTNVVVTPGPMGLSGCGAFGSVASLFLGYAGPLLAKAAANAIEAQSYTFACP